MQISDEIYAAMLLRIQAHSEFLKTHHPEVFDEQKHCDEGTIERAYWHYGYLVALRDIVRQVKGIDKYSLDAVK